MEKIIELSSMLWLSEARIQAELKEKVLIFCTIHLEVREVKLRAMDISVQPSGFQQPFELCVAENLFGYLCMLLQSLNELLSLHPR